MKKQIVYYGHSANKSSELVGYAPEPLLKNCKELFASNKTDVLLQCYAITEEMKNTFVIRAPFDLDISFSGPEKGFVINNMHLPQQEFNSMLQSTPDIVRNIFVHEALQLFLGFSFHFFSEKPLKMSTLPAHYHETGVSAIPYITGSYDISKWFRPVNACYLNYSKKDMRIKRGDALFYVKFDADQRVELQPFKMTDDLVVISEGNTDIVRYKKRTPLRDLYAMFSENRLNKKVLQKIQEQLL